ICSCQIPGNRCIDAIGARPGDQAPVLVTRTIGAKTVAKQVEFKRHGIWCDGSHEAVPTGADVADAYKLVSVGLTIRFDRQLEILPIRLGMQVSLFHRIVERAEQKEAIAISFTGD